MLRLMVLLGLDWRFLRFPKNPDSSASDGNWPQTSWRDSEIRKSGRRDTPRLPEAEQSLVTRRRFMFLLAALSKPGRNARADHRSGACRPGQYQWFHATPRQTKRTPETSATQRP